MKNRATVLCLLCAAIAIGTACQGSTASLQPAADYLGQSPPRGQAELFAPGLISTGMLERDVAMTPDGNEMYFGLIAGPVVTILVSRREGGRWTEPEIAPFARDARFGYFEPHVTPDGSRVLFLCTRPPQGKEPRPGWFYQNIWAADRQADGSWGEIYDLGSPVNSDDNEYFPSVTRDGTLYFTRSKRGERSSQIYRSRQVDGAWAEPEPLPQAVNGGGNIYNAFVAPDENYLIGCVPGGANNPGPARYTVFFRDSDDNWSEGVDLGEQVNPPDSRATSAYVSPDGNYLFFAASHPRELADELTYQLLGELHDSPQNGSSDIYWIEAALIHELRATGLK